MAKKINTTGHIGLMSMIPALTLGAICFTGFKAMGQSVPGEPKLVVGITIEGLSLDYLNRLRDNFGNDGLGYLLDNAVTFTDVDFGSSVDGPTANAIIYTGASPIVNGISAEKVLDVASRRVVPVLNSDNPSAAEENFSPSRLLVSTLTDELKIERGIESQVHSIAGSPSMAITSGGHAANSAYWINDASGRWTTSTYFADRPAFLQYRNRMQPLDAKLDTMVWTPLPQALSHPQITSLQREYPFRLHFTYGDPARYAKYKQSPKSFDEITEVATEYISNLELGKHASPDMLTIAYSIQPYASGNANDAKLQSFDSYLRLDKALDRLFNDIDKTAGLNNTLIFVAGTPQAPWSRRDDEKWRIPGGDFSVRKATSLLNLYLINKFGNGDWVSGYHDGYFYLNPSTISQNRADEKEVRQQAASFLQKMAGVAYAYTIDDVLGRNIHGNGEGLARNTRFDTSGDILVVTAPGWNITDTYQDQNTGLVARSTASTAPFFLLWPALEKEQRVQVIDARAIAPTIAHLMHIRAPNGAEQAPLRLQPKKQNP